MAARTLKPRHQDEIRDKIRTSQLLNRLTEHALGLLENPMDATQVTAALGVLRKTLPDLAAIEHSGDVTVHAFAVPALQAQPALTDASSEQDHKPATIDAPKWERITVQ